MSFKIKQRPTGFKKLLLATKKRADPGVGKFAITEAWLRFVRQIHRRQLVTRTGAPLWDGQASLRGKTVLLFAPQSFAKALAYGRRRWPAFQGYGDFLGYPR
jgi:hypothetical protein